MGLPNKSILGGFIIVLAKDGGSECVCVVCVCVCVCVGSCFVVSIIKKYTQQVTHPRTQKKKKKKNTHTHTHISQHKHLVHLEGLLYSGQYGPGILLHNIDPKPAVH